MNIVSKIRAIIEEQGLSFRYGTDEELNEYSDNTDMPAAFMSLLQTGRLQVVGTNDMYLQDVVITFFDRTSYSISSEENEQIVENCTDSAFRFINKLKKNGDCTIVGNVNLRKVYLRFTGVYTGVSLSFQLRANEARCYDNL